MIYSTPEEHKRDRDAFVDALAEMAQLPPVVIELPGHVPAKKNLWGPRKGGGIVLNTEAREHITALETWAKLAWNGRRAMEHPALRITFHVRNQRSDRDNKLGCILDVLQKAGVLVNDNVKHCNGTVTLAPAVIGKEEKTVIEVWAVSELNTRAAETRNSEVCADGMSDREKTIRARISSNDEMDCDEGAYLIGVIDTLRWDRKVLFDRRNKLEAVAQAAADYYCSDETCDGSELREALWAAGFLRDEKLEDAGL